MLFRSIGRLVFDDKGGVTGVSSADLDGYFLGNPVTGSYTFNTDCSLTFQLQDTSGAFQHFAGKAAPYGARVEVHQTDSDTGERGVLEKAVTGCQTGSLHGDYKFALSGTASQFATLQEPGSAVSIAGTLSADGAGNLVFVSDGGKTTGSYQADSDCIVEMELGVAQGNSAAIVKLRGVLVNGGKLLLAAESDPAAIATARLTAKP